MTGIVIRKVEDRGFGFINSGDTDYFFHRSECKHRDFDSLRAGDAVQFRVGDSPRGPRAIEVEKV